MKDTGGSDKIITKIYRKNLCISSKNVNVGM